MTLARKLHEFEKTAQRSEYQYLISGNIYAKMK